MACTLDGAIQSGAGRMLELNFAISHHFLDDRGQRAGFILLGSFLAAFLFIRTSARLIRNPNVSWWPGSVTTKGGLHLHHLVWGIVLILVSGFLNFVLRPTSPWLEIFAAMFGIGAGLTLDEFALWIHLEDVYWSKEGRSSIDAVVVAALLGGLVVLGLAPFDLSNRASPISSLVLVILIDLTLSALAILKGKPMTGLIGIFVPLFSIVGAVRLAMPTSPWARWRYPPEGHRMARSRARFKRVRERRRWLMNAIGGAPSRPADGEP
ncbi:MAG TPA: hypothetical protein VK781_09650 [Solirubrobacteraceae bacterium]|jgi:hypothetical protein|nr:hypothetical protein [Solirubrobacteraceae bacterium]